jgi:Ran GTPase-activating protein (RanGAP) involved in mRNA processing and transport
VQIDTDKQPKTTSKAEPTPPETPVPAPEVGEAPEATQGNTVNEKVTVPQGKEQNGQPQEPKPPPAREDPQVTVTAPAAEPTPPSSHSQKHHIKRPHLLGRLSQQDENTPPSQVSPKANLSPKQPPRRASWISSLSSRFSTSSAASPARRGSVDNSSNNGPPSPNVQFNNPFNNAQSTASAKIEPKKEQKQDEKQVLTPTQTPRRPSVLVQAGKERDDHPGFLQSALRRFSSSSSAGLGKAAGTGPAPTQRKIMNVDQNRERVKIADFDPSKLRRVAFCVDVEVAGYASWHEVEEYEAEHKEQKAPEVPVARRQSLSMLERQVQAAKNKKGKDGKKDVKEAIHKDKAEGAALKNPLAAKAKKEEKETTQADEKVVDTPSQPTITPAASEAQPPAEATPAAPEAPSSEPQPIPGTRRKEKKKRSEAERKERKERKRRHAEANGQVPLELTGCNDDDDSSCISVSPPGASTPNLTLSPTTDPLRIYKRCAQLRETTIVKKVCDQIASPSSILAESPGTVAVLDISGTVMTLPELVTLGDWLAVVPVRKLIIEDCQLTDEGVRVVLSGLLSCKTPEQAKQNKRLPRRGSGRKGEEQVGVIEKVSLKGNSKLTKIGWKHIALFLHMSKSLRAIDVSGIPFPDENTPGDLSRTSTANTTASNTTNGSQPSNSNLGSLLSKALAERFGGSKLEELIMSNCSLSTANIGSIVDAALKCKLRRLGLADNNITAEGVDHIVRYIESGVCEGLDLGDNDLHDCMKPLSDSLTPENNFFALSLSGCNLTPSDLKVLLPCFLQLKNFRFVDFSNNKGLFSTQPNAVAVLRKYLPQMTSLKRIHLNDVGLSSEHAIALAEILPESPSLAHLSILDNPAIMELMHAKDSSSQEEACALFASLMTAVRVSHTIVAIDIEVPSADSNEIVKALASQVVAYTLRNMEHGALKEIEGTPPSKGAPDKDAPEILLHIVGHMDGYQDNHDADEPAPDDDYLLGGNAIVKALGVCLGTADDKGKIGSRNTTPSGTPGESGTGTPRLSAVGFKPTSHKKPRDMSKQLLESARKIRMRLKPALIREDRAGNDFNYRKTFISWFRYLSNTNQCFDRPSPIPRLDPPTHDPTLRRRVPRLQNPYSTHPSPNLAPFKPRH